MSADSRNDRREFLKLAGAGAAAAMLSPISPLLAEAARRVSITNAGAVGDGTTMNTEKIQAAIDKLAASRGGAPAPA